jgi:hypothetical protein
MTSRVEIAGPGEKCEEERRPSDVWPHRRRVGRGIFVGVDWLRK